MIREILKDVSQAITVVLVGVGIMIIPMMISESFMNYIASHDVAGVLYTTLSGMISYFMLHFTWGK